MKVADDAGWLRSEESAVAERLACLGAERIEERTVPTMRRLCRGGNGPDLGHGA